jgi:hypothetical protein
MPNPSLYRTRYAGFARLLGPVNSRLDDNLVRHLLHLAWTYAILVAAAGFLFGQLFFGTFAVGATLAGASGVAAVFLSWLNDGKPRLWPLVVLCSTAGIVGVGLDAWRYYTELNIPGSYYAWFLIGPYVVALVLIGQAAWSRRERPGI